jgi:hypothetical protein
MGYSFSDVSAAYRISPCYVLRVSMSSMEIGLSLEDACKDLVYKPSDYI